MNYNAARSTWIWKYDIQKFNDSSGMVFMNCHDYSQFFKLPQNTVFVTAAAQCGYAYEYP